MFRYQQMKRLLNFEVCVTFSLFFFVHTSLESVCERCLSSSFDLLSFCLRFVCRGVFLRIRCRTSPVFAPHCHPRSSVLGRTRHRSHLVLSPVTVSSFTCSDLPEERSTVLLLGVTRIPPSPKAPRRPCSLPIGDPPPCRPASRRGPSSIRRGTPRPQTSFCLFTSPSLPLDRRDTPKEEEGHASAAGSDSVPLPACLAEGGGGTVSGRRGPPTHCGPGERLPSDEQLTAMDRSVDSIGSCSLDVDASAEYAGRGVLFGRVICMPVSRARPFRARYRRKSPRCCHIVTVLRRRRRAEDPPEQKSKNLPRWLR